MNYVVDGAIRTVVGTHGDWFFADDIARVIGKDPIDQAFRHNVGNEKGAPCDVLELPGYGYTKVLSAAAVLELLSKVAQEEGAKVAVVMLSALLADHPEIAHPFLEGVLCGAVTGRVLPPLTSAILDATLHLARLDAEIATNRRAPPSPTDRKVMPLKSRVLAS